MFRQTPDKTDLADDYIYGNKRFEISAKKQRNFAGFMTHAFEAKKMKFGQVGLDDFVPQHEPEAEWRSKLLSANVFPKNIIFDHKIYSFFENRELIKKGSYLVWDYGLGYWRGRKLAPALLSRDGKVIDAASYACFNPEYIRAFLPSPSSSSLFSLFSRCKPKWETASSSYRCGSCNLL
jgi:hypothetical protein